MYKVVVAGSINMDVVAFADRHPRVGETVPGKSIDFFPGGKGANQAVSAAKLGAETLLVAKLGTDAFSATLEDFLQNQGVNLTHVTRTDKANTGTALIVVGSNSDNTIVVVPGANAHLTPEDVVAVDIGKGDVLVSQFEIPEPTIRAFFEFGKERGAITMLNPAPARQCDQALLKLVDILVLNETELSFFLGRDIAASDLDAVRNAACTIRSNDDQVIVVTLGADGAVAVVGERFLRVPGQKVHAVDTTGAGDCYTGALAARIAGGATMEKSLRYANLAASICVQRPGAGTSMPSRDEVDCLVSEEAA